MILRTLGVAKLRSCAHGPSENCLSFLTCQFCGADCVEHPRRVDSNIPPNHPTSYYSFWVRWNISVNCLNLKGRTHGEKSWHPKWWFALHVSQSLVSSPLNIRLGHHPPTTNVSTCAKSITVHIQRLSNWEPCPGRGSPRNAGEALAGLGSGPCQICQGALQRIDHHGFKNWTYLDLSGLVWPV